MASFYVNKSSKTGWRLIQQTYDKQVKKYIQKTVPKDAYAVLGFNPEWSLDEAKKRVKELNSTNSEERKTRHQAASSAMRSIKLDKLASTYAPEDLCRRFIEKLMSDSFGSERHKKRLVYHFNYIQKMVTTLKLDASTFKENKERIYHYFEEQCTSLDSVGTILRVMNKWAKFVCKERNQYYEEIDYPKGRIRTAIEEAYLDSEDFRGESDPLTADLLERVKDKLSLECYNWLYLTIWLGTRPQETTNLHNSKFFKVFKDKNIDVISIYMPKLTSLSRDKRWKLIPLLYPEQVKCLEIINSCKFKAPTLKKMQDLFGAKRMKGNKASGNRINLYGGRKGFVDIMMDRNQKLEDISQWLGHQTIETTWRKYRNRKRISYNRTG